MHVTLIACHRTLLLKVFPLCTARWRCRSGTNLIAARRLTLNQIFPESLCPPGAATPKTANGNGLRDCGFARDEAFDESELEPLHLRDVKPGRPDVVQWSTPEVLAGHRDGDNF